MKSVARLILAQRAQAGEPGPTPRLGPGLPSPFEEALSGARAFGTAAATGGAAKTATSPPSRSPAPLAGRAGVAAPFHEPPIPAGEESTGSAGDALPIAAVEKTDSAEAGRGASVEGETELNSSRPLERGPAESAPPAAPRVRGIAGPGTGLAAPRDVHPGLAPPSLSPLPPALVLSPAPVAPQGRATTRSDDRRPEGPEPSDLAATATGAALSAAVLASRPRGNGEEARPSLDGHFPGHAPLPPPSLAGASPTAWSAGPSAPVPRPEKDVAAARPSSALKEGTAERQPAGESEGESRSPRISPLPSAAPAPPGLLEATARAPEPARPRPPATLPALPAEPGETLVSGSVLPAVAHLRVSSQTLGDLAVHLRMQEGAAHVRVEGAAKSEVESRAPELARALAAEGIGLARIEGEPAPHAASSTGQNGPPDDGGGASQAPAHDQEPADRGAPDRSGERAPTSPPTLATRPTRRGGALDVTA
ncbi:MAG TPA: hypothetical protein VFG53_09335 [Anaeromyxobacter sp.]|nr:hypothetical protein [Anaeromyxobacter sp.]